MSNTVENKTEEVAQSEERINQGMTHLEIVIGKPPIWEEAHKHFKINDNETVYTYGEKIYNPAGFHIPNHLMAHEAMHADRQIVYPGGPKAWWAKYFEDAAFRQAEELIAYQGQYQYYCMFDFDRNRRARFLVTIASDMASPMYNAGIAPDEARRIIKGNTH